MVHCDNDRFGHWRIHYKLHQMVFGAKIKIQAELDTFQVGRVCVGGCVGGMRHYFSHMLSAMKAGRILEVIEFPIEVSS